MRVSSSRPLKPVQDLFTALSLEPREHLALVGGGGKTTLLLTLAEELIKNHKRIVMTTTTKIWHREIRNAPCVLWTQTDPEWRTGLRLGLRRYGRVALGRRLLDSGKIEGVPPALADELYLDEEIDYMIVEADGAAGHPVKAPAAFEPPVPASATRVVALMGLEAIGQKMEAENVFRVDLFQELTGIKKGQNISLSGLARLFKHPAGLFKTAPPSAKRVAFLNKIDLLTAETPARDLAFLLLQKGAAMIDRVIIGSIKKGYYLIGEDGHERYLPEGR